MPKRQFTKGQKLEVGFTVPEKPCSTEERERLEKWGMMASLMVFKGLSQSAAYRLVYDDPEAVACPPSIYGSARFKGMLTRLRNAQGLTAEQVQGTIEGLYNEVVQNEEAPLKMRLQAAQQWQKLRGLEKNKEPQAVDEDELLFLQAMRPANKKIDVQVENG
jgi:hypothetical protein